MNVSQLLAVGLGGCCGSIVRYWLTSLVQKHVGGVFPYGTLAVNVIGCLLAGLLWGLVEYRQWFPPNVRLFLAVGVLGGFTTFSAFSMETFQLLRGGEYVAAIANVTTSVVIGLIAVVAGWSVAKWFAL